MRPRPPTKAALPIVEEGIMLLKIPFVAYFPGSNMGWVPPIAGLPNNQGFIPERKPPPSFPPEKGPAPIPHIPKPPRRAALPIGLLASFLIGFVIFLIILPRPK